MSIVSALKGRGPSGFGYGSTTDEVTAGLDLTGRRVLVTGCNSGLGLETMRVLCSRGATVLGAARDLKKAQEACASVTGATVPVVCELSEPASVRACVAEVLGQGAPLHAIIANAGIMALPKLERVHGFERQFFTNHIGHFILVTGLLPALAADARVVMLSSAAHTSAPRAGIEFDNLDGAKGYSSIASYGQSKLANLLFARELARRFHGTGKTANALHPGVIDTNLGRHLNPVFRGVLALAAPLALKSIPQGAATQVWAAVHPDAGPHNGAYFADCNVAKSSRLGEDAALAARLWARSEEIVAAC
jgi:WW domain-containing oxidoreductase